MQPTCEEQKPNNITILWFTWVHFKYLCTHYNKTLSALCVQYCIKENMLKHKLKSNHHMCLLMYNQALNNTEL